jgi:DNA-binding transcriptional regulator YbjK
VVGDRSVDSHTKRPYICALSQGGVAIPVDRRTVIADAALRLIGSAGTRALTHRGVDAEAGLPAGSTSYYCRRRLDLLTLALRRHAQVDLESLGRLAELDDKGSAPGLAAALASGLSAWMRMQSRAQLATRFELFLAASHEPSLLQLIDETRARFLSTLERALKRHGVRRPRSIAGAIIALVEGMLLERVRSDRDVVRASELRGWLEALFYSVQPRSPHDAAVD